MLRAFFRDQRASRIGDILTVMIEIAAMDARGGIPKNCSKTAAPAYRLIPMWISIADMMNMKARVVRAAGL